MIFRLYDIFFSILILVVISPILILVPLYIFICDGAPIFYRQKRIGLNGIEFSIFKFRTMVINASGIGPYYTSDNDPRITKIGGLLRKTSIDELPQFLNVLIGDMSIVGPRPNVMAQKARYTSNDWDARNSVKPGITGIAQVYGRSSCTFEERLNSDLEYIKQQGVVFDTILIFKTVLAVLLKRSVN
jgi:lipopolysaccharide/colanic/teichoic acid biosynthesis glycosyltransferase